MASKESVRFLSLLRGKAMELWEVSELADHERRLRHLAQLRFVFSIYSFCFGTKFSLVFRWDEVERPTQRVRMSWGNVSYQMLSRVGTPAFARKPCAFFSCAVSSTSRCLCLRPSPWEETLRYHILAPVILKGKFGAVR